MKKLYNKERDTDGYDNIVMKHLLAMTTEELHGKVIIAVELAYRDWQIEQLREALQGFLDAHNEGHEPSSQTVFLASIALEETK